jgi:hypothetical protein
MKLHLQYNEPIKKDICVAFCYFNACGYVRSLQNLLFFENKLRAAKIPYFSAEMVIGDQPPMLASPTLRFHSKSALFYKEALWNRLEQAIPEQYTKICFLDSDIIFDRPDWLDAISELLDSHDMVHPFETMSFLDIDYNIISSRKSNICDTNSWAIGYGYAIKRLFFKNINGFFDKAILGSGDTYLSMCIKCKNDKEIYILTINKYLSSQIIIYKEKFQSFNPKVTYLPCNIYHLYHGSIIQRNYDSRYKNINLDNWDSIFQLNSDGFWEFTDSSMDSLTFNYFKSRKEDLAKYVKTSDIGIQARPDTKDAANNPSLISVRSIRK